MFLDYLLSNANQNILLNGLPDSPTLLAMKKRKSLLEKFSVLKNVSGGVTLLSP